MGKHTLQKSMRQDLEYLRAQLRAYQQIAADCLAAAHGVSVEECTPPPVELGVDYSDVEVTLRVQAWWKRRVDEYIDKTERCRECGSTFLYHPEND